MIRRYWAKFGGSARGSNFGEKLNIHAEIGLELFGKIILVKNSLNRANRLACTAINAFIWVDV